MSIILKDKNGKRLCKDWMFRDFASFGTYPECIKIYKRAGSAKRAIGRFRINAGIKAYRVPEGALMDASGEVWKEEIRGDFTYRVDLELEEITA
jgi:hypothetical protein